ncbi:pseudouridine synthase [Lactarius deliciosus]|nr:pseudouridine synthase [Lactarius deliciosus]
MVGYKLRHLASLTAGTTINLKLESSLPVFPFHTNKLHLPLYHLQTTRPGLRKIAPYWYPYTTMAKGRWLDREILEIVSTEFRDRSTEYYRYALESGVTTINGKIAKPDTIPPVTSRPVKILHEDWESEFIVIDKLGSIPVHATGRYFYLSLVEILQREFGYQKVYTVNRLDRLTSGLMIIGLSSSRAHVLSQEFVQGEVKKEYIARCSGEFPAEEVVVDQPLLTVDRQMGLNIVHPDGKAARTIFTRLHYDKNTNTSVLHSHQIRVRLQYLGYPIANDPVYSETKIWGPNLGKGGIDTTPSDDRAPPVAPVQISGRSDPGAGTSVHPSPQLPRETGKDIGMGSPVPLSAGAVGVITRLRNMKDEDEDWSRWRDVVFKAKGRLHPTGIPAQKSHRSCLLRTGANGITVQEENDGALYCGECYLPLHPDPSPERLYIFLYALRYTTGLGVFETEMPEWAANGWEWERSF